MYATYPAEDLSVAFFACGGALQVPVQARDTFSSVVSIRLAGCRENKNENQGQKRSRSALALARKSRVAFLLESALVRKRLISDQSDDQVHHQGDGTRSIRRD